METKQCTTCKCNLPKTTEYFATRNDRKEVRYQSSCRKCQKEYRREHYKKNREKYIQKVREYKESNLDWFQDIKKKLKCENCDEGRWWVLDFHHINPMEKESDISTLIRNGNREKVLKEIDKCKVLCSNCHRDLHYKEKMRN